MKPWRHRPIPGDPNWENNWLSNSLAWASELITPNWCLGGHWTERFAGYLWAECACCLMFRGIVIGFIVGSASVVTVVNLIN